MEILKAGSRALIEQTEELLYGGKHVTALLHK